MSKYLRTLPGEDDGLALSVRIERDVECEPDIERDPAPHAFHRPIPQLPLVTPKLLQVTPLGGSYLSARWTDAQGNERVTVVRIDERGEACAPSCPLAILFAVEDGLAKRGPSAMAMCWEAA